MAKWGEGDPRWIVEERADSHNVNNWHWKEIDSSPWSKDYLKKLLTEIVLDDGKTGMVKIIDVPTLEGEATCSIRKQKFIFIFDWEKVSLKWTGRVNGMETEFEGVVKVGGFDHDADDEDELDFEVRFKKEGPPEHAHLKGMIKKLAPKAIWKAFMTYKKSCKDHFSEKLALGKDAANIEKQASEKNKKVGIDLDQAVPINKLDLSPGKNGAKTSPRKNESSSSAAVGAKINTRKITMSDVFKASKDEVFSVFIDVNKIKAWSQNSLHYKHSSNLSESTEFQKGTTFDLFSNNVSGVVQKIIPTDSLELQWRLRQWPESHFSTVVIKFEQVDDGTKVSLEQTSVPSDFVQNTTDGWKRYYFSAIKNIFGMGMGFR